MTVGRKDFGEAAHKAFWKSVRAIPIRVVNESGHGLHRASPPRSMRQRPARGAYDHILCPAMLEKLMQMQGAKAILPIRAFVVRDPVQLRVSRRFLEAT